MGQGVWVKRLRGLRSTNRYLKNSRGDVKHSIGNGAAKELITRSTDMNNGRGIT